MAESKSPCSVCGNEIPNNRNNEYCSKKCQAEVEGYDPAYLKALARRIDGTTAWRPDEIEPITHIFSPSPILILSDIHAPLHSKKWLLTAVELGLKLGCKDVIVNGDYIDANEISKHIGFYFRRHQMLEDGFAAGEAILAMLAANFERVFFLNGNHCGQRLIKVFGGELAMQRLWKMFGDHKNVKVSARSYILVNSKVIVGHPRSYSRVRGNLSQKIAQNKQRSVVLGHTHHSARSITADGRHQAVEVGCLADLGAFEYTGFEINDMPEPMNGFAVVHGDLIENFDRFTMWKHWGVDDPEKR